FESCRSSPTLPGTEKNYRCSICGNLSARLFSLGKMSCSKFLFLSIRPRFADQIFAGTKTVELRRVRHKVSPGDAVIVYVSGATKAVLGAFRVAGLYEAAPSSVWRKFGGKLGLTKTEFDSYFEGREVAFGIEISCAWKL